MYRGFNGIGNCMRFVDRIGYGHMNGGSFMPMIGMGLLAVLAVIAVIFIMKKIARTNKNQTYDASTEELKTRFVKGEITEEEYLRMKKLINQ